MNVAILLAIIFVIAVFLGYYIVKTPGNYKKLAKKNQHKIREAGWPSMLGSNQNKLIKKNIGSTKQLFYMPILYVGWIVTGIIQLKLDALTSGAGFILLGMIGFIVHLYQTDIVPEIPQLQEKKRKTRKNTSLSVDRGRILSWLIVVLLLAYSIYATAKGDKGPTIIRIGIFAWIASVLLGVLTMFWDSIVHSKDMFKSFSQKLSTHSTEVLLVIAMVLLTIFMRTYALPDHPYPWSGDETAVGVRANEILSGQEADLFDVGWAAQPNWSFFPTAILIKIFGVNITAVRLASAIPGILAIFFSYLLAREMFNPTIALISGLFLATFPHHLQFSRIGVNNIIDSMMAPLVLWLLTKAHKAHSHQLYYLAGAIAGLSVYTYVGTKLVPFLAAVILIFYLFHLQVPWASKLKYFSLFFVATFITCAPQIIRSGQSGNLLIARLSDENIMLNGWLANLVSSTGKTALEILLNQFNQTIMVFFAWPAKLGFFHSPKPYLTILGSIFFLFGMAYTFSGRSKLSSIILLFWFWIVIFLGGVLTANPPANTRLLMSTPVTAMFIALGVFLFIQVIKGSFAISLQNTNIFLWLITVCLLAQNFYFYMVEYKNNYYYQDPGPEFATEVSLAIQSNYPESHIYLLGGTDRYFANFPMFEFLDSGTEIIDLVKEDTSKLVIKNGESYAFFATPENHDFLAEIMKQYQGGEFGSFLRKPPPHQLLFEYYILDYK